VIAPHSIWIELLSTITLKVLAQANAVTLDKPYVPVHVPPMPDDAGRLRFLRSVISNPLAAIPQSAYRQGLSQPGFANSNIAFVCDPDVLEEVLIERVGDFPKSLIDQQIMRPAVGDSLLMAEGETWRWKRRLAAPFFTPAALSRSAPQIAAPFQALAQVWRTRRGSQVDVVAAMTAATLDVIDSLLFSRRGEIDPKAISGAIDDYLDPISWRIGLASLGVPSWMPFPGWGKMMRAKSRMRRLIQGLIAKRRSADALENDLCGKLMGARDPETDRPLSDEDLVDMLLTLIAAGHETSANALSWAILCLAEAPQIQEQLVKEIAAVAGTESIGTEHLARLPTVKAFLMETMRLFPPVPVFSRRTIKPETFGGHKFAPGTMLFIPVYAIHRHERLWRNPTQFDISRFMEGRDKLIARTAYLPFGAGPRICIGASLAMMEMTIGLATLLQSVHFKSVEGFVADPISRVTLRSRHGLSVRLA
jgi:cytochrome P450